MDIASRYLDQLTEQDLTFLASAIGAQGAQFLGQHPNQVAQALSDPRVFQRIFGEPRQAWLERVSAFLVFAVIVHRVAQELEEATAVQEWVGPRQRLWVFDVEPLRQFLRDAALRLFLVELLGSYTHVHSGSVRVRDRRGWRRVPVSELDPLHLVQLLDVVVEAERIWVYRRLGDLALFLTGVFPDFVARAAGGAWRRWYRTRLALARPETRLDRADEDALALVEETGRLSYAAALKLAGTPVGELSLVSEVLRRFSVARRVLNVIVDRYILPQRHWWFPFARA
ncbi:MAG: hypothetical protein K6U87_15890 [Firmicutes bacterium]|nr:hypothetical protein [Bacillota bacterium]